MAKSVIKKIIKRKIKTAQFESLDIELEVEEQIVWETEEERKAATAKLTQRLLDDFTESYNEACTRIGVDRCVAVVSTKSSSNDSAGESANFDLG